MFNYHTLQLVVDQHADPNMPRVFSRAIVRHRRKKNAEEEEEKEEWNELREPY